MSSNNGRQKIGSAPRLYINAGVLAGGAIGFLLQAELGLDDIQAFIFVATLCLIGAAIANFGWLFLKDNRDT